MLTIQILILRSWPIQYQVLINTIICIISTVAFIISILDTVEVWNTTRSEQIHTYCFEILDYHDDQNTEFLASGSLLFDLAYLSSWGKTAQKQFQPVLTGFNIWKLSDCICFWNVYFQIFFKSFINLFQMSNVTCHM